MGINDTKVYCFNCGILTVYKVFIGFVNRLLTMYSIPANHRGNSRQGYVGKGKNISRILFLGDVGENTPGIF